MTKARTLRLTTTILGGFLAACGVDGAIQGGTGEAGQSIELGSTAGLPEGIRANSVVARHEVAMSFVTPAKVDLVTLNHFCPALATAMCAPKDGCGCGEEAASCAAEVEQECRGQYGLLSPAVLGEIGAGHLVYDGRAAHRLLERLAEGTRGCLDPIQAVNFTRRELVTFAGVFVGQVKPGEQCNLPFVPFQANVCAESLCLPDESGRSKCVQTAGIGEACDAKTACMQMDRGVTVQNIVEGALLASCVTMDDGERACQAPAIDGGACSVDADCESHRCQQARCAPRGLVGEQCSFDYDCASSYCKSGTCAVDALPLGAQCDRDAQCSSGACYGDACAEPLCG